VAQVFGTDSTALIGRGLQTAPHDYEVPAQRIRQLTRQKDQVIGYDGVLGTHSTSQPNTGAINT
jgi:hypothetical protein